MADITAIAKSYAEKVWNQRDLDAADAIFTPDHRYHDTLMPDLPPGPQGVKARRQAYMAAMPDATVTLRSIVTQGDMVASDWTYSGTNTGELMGIPPTGRAAVIGGSHFFRFEGDRIAETWTYPDNLGLLQQLGLVTIGPAA